MNENLLVTCGCSFTMGWTRPGNVSPYGELLSKKLNSDFINLAVPGASCYRIAKQVEESIPLKPKLLILGITTPLRFEFNIDENINSRPSLAQFTDNPYEVLTDKIETRSLASLDRFIHDASVSEQNKLHYKNIYEYHEKYTNVHIKRDQDQYIIAGACCLLERENIPYIVIQFDTHPFVHARKNYFQFTWTSLIKQFPLPEDRIHFNKDGHVLISDTLYRFIKIKKLW